MSKASKAVEQSAKTAGAALLSFVLISFLLLAYSFCLPHIDNKGGNTDFKWVANSYWINGYEGYGFGKFDANGFNNTTVYENPDIVIVGSSHMEATHVRQTENTASKLMHHLSNSNKEYSVYNMGVAGHTFEKVCAYLPDTFNQFNIPPKYLIIETETTDITASNAKNITEHNIVVQKSYSGGFLGLLQKIPVFRVFYSQIIRGLFNRFVPDYLIFEKSKNTVKKTNTISEEPYDTVMKFISEFESTYGTQIIIFYHPMEKIEKTGNVSFTIKESASVFENYCNLYNINFINMEQPFIQMYKDSHLLPHGFATGRIGEGHLNANGHNAIAKSICELIVLLES